MATGVSIERHPPTRNRSLRGWDAADEYLIDDLANHPGGRWLIVNDGFGALTVSFADRGVSILTDSVSAEHAIDDNLRANGVDRSIDRYTPLDELDGRFDTVVIKVPKTLSLLEHELRMIRCHLAPDAVVVGAGMVKHIHTSTLEVFSRVIGPTTTSLAKKKARLIRASVAAETVEPGQWRFPISWSTDDGVTVVSHANVFAAEKLDVGTRLLLANLPVPHDGADVVDLGCGNGVVAASLARRFGHGSVLGTDVSHLAVASARATYAASVGDDRGRFVAMDALADLEPASVDLVVNNPPFHDAQVIGDETAWRMFVHSRRALRPGGELRVVGNRHLGYHTKLKRLFGNCRTVASNNKFVVLSAVR
jgi:16S rRNA (guanine1207-N2)-methyltransferase